MLNLAKSQLKLMHIVHLSASPFSSFWKRIDHCQPKVKMSPIYGLYTVKKNIWSEFLVKTLLILAIKRENSFTHYLLMFLDFHISTG